MTHDPKICCDCGLIYIAPYEYVPEYEIMYPERLGKGQCNSCYHKEESKTDNI